MGWLQNLIGTRWHFRENNLSCDTKYIYSADRLQSTTATSQRIHDILKIYCIDPKRKQTKYHKFPTYFCHIIRHQVVIPHFFSIILLDNTTYIATSTAILFFHEKVKIESLYWTVCCVTLLNCVLCNRHCSICKQYTEETKSISKKVLIIFYKLCCIRIPAYCTVESQEIV